MVFWWVEMKYRLCIKPLTAILGALVAVTLAVTPIFAQTSGGNQVITEDFEGAFTNDSYCADNTCMKPDGWGVWFIPRKNSDLQGINFAPKFEKVTNVPNRIKQGAAALHQFTNSATHTGGIYRIISDVKPGSHIKFTIQGSVWSTNDDSPNSTRPSSDIKLKVGIDPMGGNEGKASPLNGQVVWSADQDAKDKFATFSVETDARSSTVIVYVYATMKDPVKHNEIYWDDAKIEISAPQLQAAMMDSAQASGTGLQAGAAPAPQGSERTLASSPGVTPTTATTATALAAAPQPATVPLTGSSGKKYTVQAGDTLSSIALENLPNLDYAAALDKIRKLNNLQGDILAIGQVLLLEPASAPPTPTPAPPTPVPVAQAAPQAAPAKLEPGKACVNAYFDLNGNGKHEAAEDLVPNVTFALSSNGAVVNSYTSTGLNEPRCFDNLADGTYIASAVAPPNYNVTSPMNDSLAVKAGKTVSFEVGLRRVSDGAVVLTPKPAAVAPVASAAPNIGGFIALAAGLALIIGSAGLGVTLFLRRRQL